MAALMERIIPIVFLIVIGIVLRRTKYVNEATMQGLTHIVANMLIPCVIFTTFINLDIRPEHLFMALSFAGYQGILLGISWLLYKALRMKRRFMPFFIPVFSFGFMALPLFTTVFGLENANSLVSMGIGHEIFVGIIYFPLARLYLQNEQVEVKKLGKVFLTPLFVMIFAALILKFGGFVPVIAANPVGKGLFSAISQLGGMASVLTMLIVGYRMSFQNKSRMVESVKMVALRYVVLFAVGYPFKWLVMDRFAANDPYFSIAFFTMLSQHGSVALNAIIGEYCSQEDLEIASNAFVINAITGIVAYIVMVFSLGAL